MVQTPQHTYQILTKRPQRIRHALGPEGIGFYGVAGPVPCPQPNIWIGTSVEDQHWADIRIPKLLASPAAIRFLSCEPLLGPIDLLGWHEEYDERLRLTEARDAGYLRGIGWVIVGGESGPECRPMDPVWPRTLRDQCVAAGVPFFFKQWGGLTPKSGGRLLDGQTWDQMPAEPVGERRAG